MQMKWKHAVGFDLTGASGNTDSFGLGIRLDSKLGNKMREYDFYLSYLSLALADSTADLELINGLKITDYRKLDT